MRLLETGGFDSLTHLRVTYEGWLNMLIMYRLPEHVWLWHKTQILLTDSVYCNLEEMSDKGRYKGVKQKVEKHLNICMGIWYLKLEILIKLYGKYLMLSWWICFLI